MAKTSTTITFVSSTANENDHLSVQLDEEANGGTLQPDGSFSGASSQFQYGETAFYQVFKNPNNLIISQVSTDGLITLEGAGDLVIKETIQFVDSLEASVGKPIKNIVSYSWFGSSLGAVSALGSTGVKAELSGLGILEIVYTSPFTRYGLTLPFKDVDEYPVLVQVIGTRPPVNE